MAPKNTSQFHIELGQKTGGAFPVGGVDFVFAVGSSKIEEGRADPDPLAEDVVGEGAGGATAVAGAAFGGGVAAVNEDFAGSRGG